MTIIWLFLVVSWNGEVMAYHGFKGEEDCTSKRNTYYASMHKQVRDVTECIGVPVRGRK